MFPYISGLRFTHNFLKQGGYKSIDKIYQQPPVSTEAILHPEKYSYHTREFSIPTDQEILAASGIPNATIKDSDTLGEFMLSLLLGSGNSKTQAALAAAGWAGDKVVLAKSTNATQVLLLTLWDTPKDAQEFLNAGKEFRGALAKEKLGHSNFDIPRIRELDPKKVLITVGVKE
jgi:hypothetical protein